MIQHLLCLSFIVTQMPAIEIADMKNAKIDVPIRIEAKSFQSLNTSESYHADIEGDEEENGIPLQISEFFGAEGKRTGPFLSFILPLQRIPQSDSVRLQIGKRQENQSIFRFEEKADQNLRLFEGDQPVMVYNFGMVSKEGVPEDRTRSCYVHPLYGLDGEIISDDFPRDHYHHRGLFWTWPHVEVGERDYDLWHIRGIRQKFVRWLYRETGPVFASFGVENGWFTGEKQVVEERIEFMVFRTGTYGRAIDVKLHFRAIDEPVTLRGTSDRNKGYGGFCFRPAPREDARIVTSGGYQEKDSDRKPFPWADMSARFRGRDQITGITIMQDDKNPGFPAGWTLRYYGFLGVAWPGLDDVTMKPGGPGIHLHYRVWIHKGDVEEGKVKNAFQMYSDPFDRIQFSR